MIVDNTLVFSDSQTITATAASANTVDIGAAGTAYGHAAGVRRDIGKASEIPFACSIVQAFNNLTSLNIAIQVDDNAAFSSPTEVASRTYTLAEINSTRLLTFPAEMPEGSNEQFVRLFYTVTGVAPTTGKIFAGIVASRPTN